MQDSIKTQDSIVKEVSFNNDIDSVWNAISKQEEIEQWFVNADFKAEPGYAYTFTSKGEDCSQINGVVKSATPYHLAYTWVVQGTTIETLVEWKLEKIESGTKLTIEHTGISKYEESMAAQLFEGFSKGWIKCVSDLTSYLSN